MIAESLDSKAVALALVTDNLMQIVAEFMLD